VSTRCFQVEISYHNVTPVLFLRKNHCIMQNINYGKICQNMTFTLHKGTGIVDLLTAVAVRTFSAGMIAKSAALLLWCPHCTTLFH
jgi:hypothetical protein